MFDAKSRYFKVTPYIMKDHRGRDVTVVPFAPAPEQSLLGIHFFKQGERLDHLAAKYLSDPAGYWRIAEQNDVIFPEVLSEAREIEIPGKKG